jgi:DNA/RNA-binding domain of Phe-tRNA-synthetase-like protein
MTINFHIHRDVLGLFPELRVFSVLVRGVTPSPAFIELATRRLEEAVTHLRLLLPTPEALMSTPLITQWRDAYKSMGVKPSAYRCSFEALGRRAIAGKPLDTGMPTVNLYNATSIRHMACLGCDSAMLPWSCGSAGPKRIAFRRLVAAPVTCRCVPAWWFTHKTVRSCAGG